MARAGLGDEWSCTFANDFDAMKVATYAANWGSEDINSSDIAELKAEDIAGMADLCWASFPCQDLSLAGNYLGMGESGSSLLTRSGTFWPFWKLIQSLREEKRQPNMLVLENVYGMLTSRNGKDFFAVCNALESAEYLFGAMVLDAKHFVPQSRQRVFFLAVKQGSVLPSHLTSDQPDDVLHPDALKRAQSQLKGKIKKNWLWWKIPIPRARSTVLADFIEEHPLSCDWHSVEETAKILNMMSEVNVEKVRQAQSCGKKKVGTLYKRTRSTSDGKKVQRAEVRFDDIAGCLRTPGGGSSRQTIMVVEGQSVKTRLLSTREAARLMGLSELYKLPERYNDAYKIAGDGVCVPVVKHIKDSLLNPIFYENATSAFSAMTD